MALNHFLTEQAKILYMQYMEPPDIAKKLNMEITTISNYVYRGVGYDKTPWRELRIQQTKDLLQNVKEHNKVRITNIFKLGLPLIEKALKERAKSEEPMTIDEAKKITDIIVCFDKLERLDDNKPTEIVEGNVKNVTLEELRRKVLSDPFADVELTKGIDYGAVTTDPFGGVPKQDINARGTSETEGTPTEPSGS